MSPSLEPIEAPPAPAEGATFTCPMHPEIVRSGPGSCPICGMALEPMTVSAEEEVDPELEDMESPLVWASLDAHDPTPQFSSRWTRWFRACIPGFTPASLTGLDSIRASRPGGLVGRTAVFQRGAGPLWSSRNLICSRSSRSGTGAAFAMQCNRVRWFRSIPLELISRTS